MCVCVRFFEEGGWLRLWSGRLGGLGCWCAKGLNGFERFATFPYPTKRLLSMGHSLNQGSFQGPFDKGAVLL